MRDAIDAAADASEAEVIDAVVTRLHALAQERPRRHRAFQVRSLGGPWTAPHLVARVESQRYGSRRRERPVLSAYFVNPKTGRRLTVRVGVDAPGWWRGFVVVTSSIRPDKIRAEYLKGARHSRRGIYRREQHWQVAPDQTPRDLTALVLTLFLWRAGVLEAAFEQEHAGNRLAARVIRKHLWSTGRKDPGAVISVLDRLRGFAFPESWKEFRKYVYGVAKSVSNDISSHDPSNSAPVPRATYFRLRRKGLDNEAISRRAEARNQRRQVIRYLEEIRRNKPETARKFVQRALRGESIASLSRRVIQEDLRSARSEPRCEN